MLSLCLRHITLEDSSAVDLGEYYHGGDYQMHNDYPLCFSLLQYACTIDAVKCFKVLEQQHRASEEKEDYLDDKNYFGHTLMHFCAYDLSAKTLDYLLSIAPLKINERSKCYYQSDLGSNHSMGLSPLHCVLLGALHRYGQEVTANIEVVAKIRACVKLLLDKGANVHALTGPIFLDQTVDEIYSEDSWRYEMSDSTFGSRFSGVSALHLAVLVRDVVVVQMLLSAGAVQCKLSYGKL